LPVLLDVVAVLGYLSHSLPLAGGGRTPAWPEAGGQEQPAAGMLFPECPPHFRAQAASLYRAAGLGLLGASLQQPASVLLQAAAPFARAGLLEEAPFDLLAPSTRAGVAEASAAEAPCVPMLLLRATAPSGREGLLEEAPADPEAASPQAGILEVAEQEGAAKEGTALEFLLEELSGGTGASPAEGLARRLARYAALLQRAGGPGPVVPAEVLDALIAAMGRQLSAQAAYLPFGDVAAALETLADAAVQPRAVVESLLAAAEARFPPAPCAGDRGTSDTASVAVLCRALGTLGLALGSGLQVRLLGFAEGLAEGLAQAPALLGERPLTVAASLANSLHSAGALNPPVLAALLHTALEQSGLAGRGPGGPAHGVAPAATRGVAPSVPGASLDDLTDFLTVLLPLMAWSSEEARVADSQATGRPLREAIDAAIAASTAELAQALEAAGGGGAGALRAATAQASPARLLRLVQAVGALPPSLLGGASCQHLLTVLLDCLLRSKQALGPSGLSSCLHHFAQARLLQSLDSAAPPRPTAGSEEAGVEPERGGEGGPDASVRLPRLLAELMRSVMTRSRRLNSVEAARAAYFCVLALDAKALSASEQAEAQAGLAQLLEQLCWGRQRWSAEEQQLVAAVGVLLRSEFPELLRGPWLSRTALAELEELRRSARGGLVLPGMRLE